MWFKRSLNLFIPQLLPIIILKPWMTFHLVRPIKSQSMLGLPLNRLIYEIRRLNRPAPWKIPLFNPHLFRQNLVSDLSSTSPGVRTFSHHALIGDDPQCVIVDSYSVVLTAHHFRGHIPRCSRSVLSVVRSPYPCNAKVCYS